jgi:hypothetical protein
MEYKKKKDYLDSRITLEETSLVLIFNALYETHWILIC